MTLSVAVADDLGARRRDRRGQRHGGPGFFLVAKVAGAAAAQGLPLGSVAAIAAEASRRVASLSATFAACTLPGAEAPAFTVQPGHMAIGPGKKGESHLDDDVDIPTSDELAELLVTELLEANPMPSPSDRRVALVLSGSGSTRHEELFVIYRRISQLLTEADVIPVQPVVGEIHTNLATAGVSLALLWLNDELAQFWSAPADTPGFKRASTPAGIYQAPSTSALLAERREASVAAPKFRLDNQSALVTGAASGIGRRVSVGLAEAGSDVACIDLPGPGLDDVVREIQQLELKSLAFPGDVTDAAALAEAVQRTSPSLARSLWHPAERAGTSPETLNAVLHSQPGCRRHA